ncbi:MAG: ParB/RepB/Spo0J family partition protein [Leptospiraceae bacterium]|jgi:ParB family chromosome partitioning protein|nr:ParB/RepB/Spo0J family partition protein [Leptospiraceae bacterium]
MAGLRKVGKTETESLGNSATSHFANVQQVLEIPVERIDLDPKKNIRDSYDQAGLAELARSIETDGLLEPVGISSAIGKNGKYQLIYGFRRALAIAKFTNLKIIRAITVDSTADLDVIQLLENIQREDLSDYEIAKSLSKIKKSTNANNEELATRLNKSVDWIKKKMVHSKILDEMEEDSTPEQLRTLRNLTTQAIAPISKLTREGKKEALDLAREGKATVANLREFSKRKKIGSSNSLADSKKTKPLSKAQIQRISEIKSRIAKLSADKIKIEKDIQKLEKELVGIGQ